MLRLLWVVAACSGMALAAPSPVHAQLESTVSKLGTDVTFKLLHGYPRSPHAFGGPLTIGLELTNAGPAREVRVVVEGEVSFERNLRLAAHEQRRWFAYLPVREGELAHNTVDVTDLASGASKRQLTIKSVRSEPMLLARLGPMSGALNVDKPFGMIGALDGFMPDDWRGLAGLRVIVMEHDYALAHPPNWRVLVDWVAAGGVLVISTPTDALGAELPPAAVSLPLQAKVEERRTGLTQRVGLGAIARVHPAELADVGINFFQRIGLCTSCGWTVERSRPSEHTRTAVKHLREAVRPPGLVIFGVLIGFALLAGPGGYVYLVLNRRRPLAYVGFVVSAALGSSALILGADLLRNGVSARVIPRSLVFVDQRVDAELGVEEIAVHVPIGFGIAVHERAGMQIMLPTQISDRSQATLHALVEPRGLLLRGAVAVRDRRLLGARWIARAQGRLSVHVEPRGLGVENHLGRDLSELRVWHAGVEHELRSLPNGARGLATPASRSLDDDRSAFLSEPFTSAARDLLQRVARGRVNERRFVANFVWNPASSGVLDDSVGAYQPGAHVIAGVY